jgi:hypothetical protein
MTQQSDWQAQAGIGAGRRTEQATGWVAWISFAGAMLFMVGFLQALQGLAALLNDGFYVVSRSGLVVDVDYSVWGWTHLLLGAVAMLTAAGLFAGNTAARVVGVIIATVSIIVNFVFLPAYPWWSTLVILFDVLVIYGLTAHGAEMKHRR